MDGKNINVVDSGHWQGYTKLAKMCEEIRNALCQLFSEHVFGYQAVTGSGLKNGQCFEWALKSCSNPLHGSYAILKGCQLP